MVATAAGEEDVNIVDDVEEEPDRDQSNMELNRSTEEEVS